MISDANSTRVRSGDLRSALPEKPALNPRLSRCETVEKGYSGAIVPAISHLQVFREMREMPSFARATLLPRFP